MLVSTWQITELLPKAYTYAVRATDSENSFSLGVFSPATKLLGLHLAVSLFGIHPALHFAHDIRPVEYRHLNEGDAATLHFLPKIHPAHSCLVPQPYAQERLHHVGTSGLITCVGVYFAIDKKTCFITHINADTKRPEGETRLILDEAEGTVVKDMARNLMKKHAEAHGWSPTNPRTRMNILLTLVMSCPKPIDSSVISADLQPMRQTGYYVAQGVREFLKMPDRALSSTSGFVVEHRGGRPVFLPDKGNDKLPSTLEGHGYEAVLETGVEYWSILPTFRSLELESG
ncbi:hypothetical protein LTR17_016627 [Elasticomyces elasticus]|nr:hypothetical protein LTR17_016627 [Elasticomyces elasticus]